MKESRTKNTARNIIYGILNQVIVLLLSFISRTIFIKILGAEYLGINGLFSDVLMMLSMADLGFGTAMVYSYYKPLAENNHIKIASLIKFYKKVYNLIALLVGIIGLTIFPFLGIIVNLKSPIPYLRVYYLFFLANTVISYLFVYKTSIIIADQKNYLVSRYMMWINSGRVILQSVFLLITKNYFVYLFIQVIATSANNIILSRKANKIYPYIRETSFELDKKEREYIFNNIKSVFIYKISGVLLNGTDNTLISMIVGTVFVGLYSNYILVITSLNNFIDILYSSATASIGNVIETEESKKRFEIFKPMQTISLIISSFITVCLFVLFNDLISVWLGDKYIFDNFTLIAILLNFYLASILHPIWSFREATGLYIQTKYIMLIAAIENIFLSILMGIHMGVAGILFASAISRLTTYFWYEPRLLFKNYFEVNVKEFYNPLVKNVIFTIFLIVSLIFLFKFIIVDSWYKLIIKTIIVGLITLVSVISFYYKTTGFKMISIRILRLLNKN